MEKGSNSHEEGLTLDSAEVVGLVGTCVGGRKR